MSLNARFQMNQPQIPIVGAGGLPQKDWFIFFANLYLGVTEGLPQSEVAIEVTGSPFTYQAVIRGQLHVGGGSVSAIEFSRNGSDWYSAGITEGFVQMDRRDYVRVTYGTLPAITFFPM